MDNRKLALGIAVALVLWIIGLAFFIQANLDVKAYVIISIVLVIIIAIVMAVILTKDKNNEKDRKKDAMTIDDAKKYIKTLMEGKGIKEDFIVNAKPQRTETGKQVVIYHADIYSLFNSDIFFVAIDSQEPDYIRAIKKNISGREKEEIISSLNKDKEKKRYKFFESTDVFGNRSIATEETASIQKAEQKTDEVTQ